jgi:hypothetical protein
MSDKTTLYVAVIIGTTIGGFVPAVFGAGLLSMWGIIGSTVGGILALWLAWKYLHG